MFKRIGLFLLTNVLVMLTVGLVIFILSAVFGVQLNPNSYSGLLFFCALFGFGGAFVSLAISRWMAKKMMGVKVIDPNAPQSGVERELLRKVHDFSRRAGLPKLPEVGIYNSPEVNAFATGPSKSKALVAVSTGLLERMDSAAVEGVLGHEVAHIANGDMVTMTLLQGIVNTFVMFVARIAASIVSNAMNRDREGGGGYFMHYMMIYLFEMLLMPLGMIVVAYFSRLREYRADAGGAQLAGRDKMVHGLESLGRTLELVDNRQQSLAAFKISGGKGKSLAALFSTHPPLEERIAKLKASSYLSGLSASPAMS